MTQKKQPTGIFGDLLEHRIKLLHTFHFGRISDATTLHDLATAIEGQTWDKLFGKMPLLVCAATERARDKRGNQATWVKSELGLSQEFHDHIRRLLGQEGREEEERSCEHALHFRLDSNGLFQGGHEMPLQLEIKKAAASRLGLGKDSLWLDLSVSNIRLSLFTTGIGMLSMNVSIRKLDEALHSKAIDLLLELAYALSHLSASPNIRLAGKQCTLSNFIGALLPEKGINTFSCTRLFTYTAARISGSIDDTRMADLAIRLGRRYTIDYHLPPGGYPESLNRPFQNILHMNSLEGGALIVKSSVGGDPQIMQNFIADRFESAYAPLLMLAYVEYLTLTRMSQQVYLPGSSIHRPDTGEYNRLVAFREDMMLFRINFRFAHVSTLTMHNEVYDNWRKAFSSEPILSEVSNDVAEVERYLNEQLEKQASITVEVASIIITAIMMLGALFGSNLAEFQELHINSPLTLWITGLVFTGALAIILVRWWQRIHRRPTRP